MIASDKINSAHTAESAFFYKVATIVMTGHNPIPDVVSLVTPEDFLTHKQLVADLYSRISDMSIDVFFDLLQRNDCMNFLGVTDTPLVYADLTNICQRIKSLSHDRKLIASAQQVIALANGDADVPASMKYARAMELFQHTEKVSRFTNLTNAIETAYKAITDANGSPVGIATGYDRFDALTNGLKPGKLYIVAGSPGMGKTIVALNWTLAIAAAQRDVMFYSLEMSSQEIAYRFMSMMTNRTSIEIERSGQDDAYLSLIAKKKAQFHDILGRVHIRSMENFDDHEEATSMQVISDYRHLRAEGADIGMVVVDYLGLMEHGEGKNSSLATSIGKTTRLLKKLAGQWSVPVVLLCQVGKEVLKRPDPRPSLADLRDSGHIEQDADMVMFVYRDAQVTGNPAEYAELIVAKNRNGKTGTIPMKDRAMYYKLENLDDSELARFAQANQRNR